MTAARTVADLQFRRATPADADAFVALMSDEAVFAQLLQMPYPSAEFWRKRLEPQASETDWLHLVAIDGARIVGSAGIHPLGVNPRRRHAGGLGISVAADWQRRGVGTALMTRLLDWADNWAGLVRIELTVYTDNARAIALYDRHGFVREGTQRAFGLRAGRFSDVHMMARLHPAPPQSLL